MRDPINPEIDVLHNLSAPQKTNHFSSQIQEHEKHTISPGLSLQ